MVRRGGLGYRTQAQKDGRSAGQRQRRMARNRKQQNRDANIYQITVRDSIVLDSNTNNKTGTFGLYNFDGEWHLTAMTVQRSKEKLVSDRKGATRSEIVDKLLLNPRNDEPAVPSDGLHLKTFDKKKDAMKHINADCSTRINTGEYIIKPEDWSRNMKIYKVDRDKYRDFKRQYNVISKK